MNACSPALLYAVLFAFVRLPLLRGFAAAAFWFAALLVLGFASMAVALSAPSSASSFPSVGTEQRI